MNWKDVNFFTNNFEFLEFADDVFSSSSKNTNRMYSSSPNFSIDGMVKKAWIIEDSEIRTLVKGGYKKSRQEPYNELLASMICEKLGYEF